MNNVTNLVIGDWSDDGHGKTATITIKSNLTSKGIEKAFKVGAKKIGVDITSLCEDYEDYGLPDEAIAKLKKAGYEGDEEEGFLEAGYESFAAIYLFTVKIGDPSFEYKEVDGKNINIGGYGLLS